MDSRQDFNSAKARHLGRLEQYVPVVARVHGKSYPEFLKVQKTFDAMVKKIEENPQAPNIGEEFIKLREITGNYSVPDGVCESYQAVYDMLAELDRAFHIQAGNA